MHLFRSPLDEQLKDATGAKHGLLKGLKVLLDIEAYDDLYTIMGNEGAYINVLHSLDMPVMSQRGISMEPGKSVSIAVTPTLIDTTLQVKERFSPEERNCYFEDEIMLAHIPAKKYYRLFV